MKVANPAQASYPAPFESFTPALLALPIRALTPSELAALGAQYSDVW